MGDIYQSRFSTKATTKEGKPLGRKLISRNDFEQIKPLAPYPHLTLDFIAALSGFSRGTLAHKYRELKREHRGYVAIAEYQTTNYQMFMSSTLAYSLTEKGKELMHDRGIDVHSNEFSGPFHHQLFASQLRASFDIAAREIETVRITSWRALRNDPRIPKQTRESDKPHYIPLPKSIHGNHSSKHLIPDCYPFIVHTGEKAYPILGIEADCGTETVKTKIRTKIAAYLYILKHQIYKDLYGFPGVYVPFITNSQTRAHNFLEEIEEATKNDTKLRQFFLVKHASAPSDFDRKPEATGHMVTEPWLRVAQQPLYLHR